MLKMYHMEHPKNPGDAVIFHNTRFGKIEDDEDYKGCLEDGLEVTGVFALELEQGRESLPGSIMSY